MLWLTVAGAQLAVACDLCSVYSPTDLQGGAGERFWAGVAGQYTYFNTLQIDGEEVPNIGNEYLRGSVWQVFAGYTLGQRVSLQFTLPILHREYGYWTKRGAESGIGDVTLVGNIRLLETSTDTFTFDWAALGGVKFPTGNSSQLNPDEPDFAPGIGAHDLALGSGSFDGLVGTSFVAQWDRLLFTGSMQYAIRTEGAFAYRFANDWTWYGGPGIYLLLRDRYTLAVQAIVSGETKGQDTIGGVPTDDTALTAVYLGPQVNFSWSSTLSAQIAADLPVRMNAAGEQVVPNYRVRAAITWRF